MSFDPFACLSPQAENTDQDDRDDLEVQSKGVKTDDKRKKQVLGGQACLWSEQTDETNYESIIWPRAAGVADLFWTGNSVGGGYPRSKFLFKRRPL